MEFGKVINLDDVDFRLPPEPEENSKFLAANLGRSEQLNLYIGCTGWGMKEWVGSVYPADARPTDFLKYYARQFNTIEHNTTHYRIPNEATVRKWYEESTPDFKFCPKIPQTISHSRHLGLERQQIDLFCHAIAGLEEKLGACFLQLPPYFGPERLGQLSTFLSRFPREIPLAVEVRHEAWFDSNENAERLFELLESHGTGAVITDVAGRRDVLHLRLTAPFSMVRFVGNDLHPSDFERMEEWSALLRHWHNQGLAEVYFFTHEPDNLAAPQAAAWLSQQFADCPGIITRGPILEDGKNPEGGQLSLF